MRKKIVTLLLGDSRVRVYIYIYIHVCMKTESSILQEADEYDVSNNRTLLTIMRILLRNV
jgi:hypothetical protein